MAETFTPVRRKKAPRTPAREPLAQSIRETLVLFGGEAHRKDVIAWLARERGHDVRAIPDDLAEEVITSFESAWRDEAQRAIYGFHLKFGEGSHRWSLARA